MVPLCTPPSGGIGGPAILRRPADPGPARLRRAGLFLRRRSCAGVLVLKDDAAGATARNGRLELAIAGVISAAGLLTSWSSYQSALWSGQQAKHYGIADAQRVRGARMILEANVNRAISVGLFNAWLEAKDGANERLATLYQSRFPADFRPAFDAWVATRPFDDPSAPPSPFAMPGFRQPGLDEAEKMEQSAEAEFLAAVRANHIADSFTRAATILAMCMFFGGIAGVFHTPRVRIALVLIAVVACVFGAGEMFSLPVLELPTAGALAH